MNCKKSTQAKVSQVRGNVLRVAVPLQKEITTLEDGRIEKRVEDFAPNPSCPTSVKLFNDTKLFSYTPEVNGNVVTFVDPGALPCGSYDIEIKCKDAQGQPMRFMGRSAVDIVEGTTDACIIAGVEFNAEMQTLLGAVFYAVGSGTDGTGGITEETDPVFSASPSAGITQEDIDAWNAKQDTLVSGDNIKTVNGVSILGAGDIDTSQIIYGKFDDNNRTAFLPARTYNPITDTWTFGETPVTLASQMIYMDVTTDKHYMYVGRNLVEVGGVSGLATVATSGSYNDLKDKPTIPTVPSNVSAFANDAGYLTQHQDISGKADKVAVVDVSSTGDVSQALAPNTFYRFGTIDSLALTLTSGTGFVMYAGKFTASSDWGGTELSVPASVTEASGNDTVEAGKVYEFSILDNVISVKEVA